MKKPLLWKLLLLFCLLLSLALMLHPRAVRVQFYHPTEERLAYYPFYASFLPWGCANFLPLLTLITAGAAAVFVGIGFPQRFRRLTFACLCALPWYSYFSWLIFSTDTPIGLGIGGLHVAALLLYLYALRRGRV